MILNGFTFFNEFDLLELRLHEMGGVVNRFVLVESTKTFTGLPKPLYYAENRERFAAWPITHVVVDDMPAGSAWDREYHQRNAIRRGLQGCKPDDVIVITDADEIVRAGAIPTSLSPGERVKFQQIVHYYWLNCRSNELWTLPAACRFDELPDRINDLRDGPGRVIPDAGWHWSYLGGVEAIRRKIASYAHTELNRADITDPAHVELCRQYAVDLFGRDLAYRFVEIDVTYPAYLRENAEKFGHLIAPGVAV